MKVLHLPTSVGGYSWGLAQAEKKIGLNSTVLITNQNWLNYKYDICLHLEKQNIIKQILTRIKYFLKIRDGFDIYHFNYGSSLIDFPKYDLNLLDLPFYKGKKVVTFNGCDARQKYPTMKRTEFSACHNDKCYNGVCNSGKLDKIRKKRIEKLYKYVDHFFALNPDLMYFLPKDKTTFLPYTIAGWDDIKEEKFSIDKKIKIVHAPTNREAKGSDIILKSLEYLKNKYKNIEIDIIENTPYVEALKKYKEAHIVIDQILIGWYGGLGVEVMKMGKPLAVFIRKEDLKFIPPQMANDLEKTVININPFNIIDELSKYIENPHLLYEKHKFSIDYVNLWHNPIHIANIVKNIYEKIQE